LLFLALVTSASVYGTPSVCITFILLRYLKYLKVHYQITIYNPA
jgi:hypothetical protein